MPPHDGSAIDRSTFPAPAVRCRLDAEGLVNSISRLWPIQWNGVLFVFLFVCLYVRVYVVLIFSFVF